LTRQIDATVASLARIWSVGEGDPLDAALADIELATAAIRGLAG
jgi:hypothetical protein